MTMRKALEPFVGQFPRVTVLYLSRDLPTALIESVFHKHRWDKDLRRSILLVEVESRLVRAVGILRKASHYSCRAQSKVKVIKDIKLVDHRDWPRFVKNDGIGIVQLPATLPRTP